MARPREFVLEEAVHDATEVFWIKGYQGTSVEDLLAKTGLAKGSLYKAFRDKRTLFLSVLDQYAAEKLASFAAKLKRPGSPKEAIRQCVKDYVETAIRSGSQGCLLTNTATEIGDKDPEVADRLKRDVDRRKALFAEAVGRAQVAGEIDLGKDKEALAAMLELTVKGILVFSHLKSECESLRGAVETALTILD